jgi:hypothetical protein
MLSDIIDENGIITDLDHPIYYKGKRIEWPPEQDGIDVIVFTLNDGTKHEVIIYNDTITTDDGDESFPNMKISLPIEGYVTLKSKNSNLKSHGGKRKTKSKRNKRKKTKKRHNKNHYKKHK